MRSVVVVPSYRRPLDLERCLAAVRRQRVPPHLVIVAVRSDDAESLSLLERLGSAWSALRWVKVSRPGVVGAMNAALDAAEGDILALVDDDAEPADDWLARIDAAFAADERLGGIGGRDDQAGASGERASVGIVQWFGRIVGNHHLGTGSARDVHVLKGVNCAFRLPLVRQFRFDERLRGQGAQVHWELALCLSIRRAGWRLVYDPAIRVRHHVAARHDADQLHRGRFDAAPHEDVVYNETLVLSEHFSGIRRIVWLLWAFLVGTAAEPGVGQLPRVLIREGGVAIARWRATVRGRMSALRRS